MWTIRKDGITTIPFRRGKALAWDFTCPHPLTASNIPQNQTPNGLANKKEELKRKKYACLTNNYEFSAIAIDSLGAYGESAVNIIKEIGKRVTEQTGNKDSFSHFRQRVSIAIQKGNHKITQMSIESQC